MKYYGATRSHKNQASPNILIKSVCSMDSGNMNFKIWSDTQLKQWIPNFFFWVNHLVILSFYFWFDLSWITLMMLVKVVSNRSNNKVYRPTLMNDGLWGKRDVRRSQNWVLTVRQLLVTKCAHSCLPCQRSCDGDRPMDNKQATDANHNICLSYLNILSTNASVIVFKIIINTRILYLSLIHI